MHGNVPNNHEPDVCVVCGRIRTVNKVTRICNRLHSEVEWAAYFAGQGGKEG